MVRIAPTLVAGLMLGALALVFGIGAFRLGFWNDDGPGPGLMPLGVSILLLPLLIVALREPDPDSEDSFKSQPLLALLVMGAYAFALPRVGFIPATVVLLATWVRGFYSQNWLRTVVCSVGLTSVGIFIFHTLLKVPMQLFPASS
jgi:putative tricarboxylic transport membrane protein